MVAFSQERRSAAATGAIASIAGMGRQRSGRHLGRPVPLVLHGRQPVLSGVFVQLLHGSSGGLSNEPRQSSPRHIARPERLPPRFDANMSRQLHFLTLCTRPKEFRHGTSRFQIPHSNKHYARDRPGSIRSMPNSSVPGRIKAGLWGRRLRRRCLPIEELRVHGGHSQGWRSCTFIR